MRESSRSFVALAMAAIRRPFTIPLMPITPELLARTHDGHREAMIELLAERYECLYRMAHALTGREDAAAGVIRLVLRQAVTASRRWTSSADVVRWFIHHSLLTIRRVSVCAADMNNIAQDPLIRSVNAGNSAYYPMFIGALRALPMQQREAFMLYHGERLDERGIGVAMDCSMQAATLHLREATRVLSAYGGNLFAALTDQFVQTYDRLAPPAEMIPPAIRADLRQRNPLNILWRGLVLTLQSAILLFIVWSLWKIIPMLRW